MGIPQVGPVQLAESLAGPASELSPAEVVPPSRPFQHVFAGLEPYLYVLPAGAMFALFIAFPVGFAFWLALRNWNGLTPIQDAAFVGFANFQLLLQDPVFTQALINTVLFTVASTIFQMVVAFLLAFAIWFFKLRFSGVLRGLYFFPTVLSMVVVGLTWRQMLEQGGPAAGLLSAIGFGHISWLADPSVVMWVVIWVSSWQWSGWTMVLYLAGMTGIPDDLIEAARVDGAGSFLIMRRIVVPMLGYVTGLAILLNVIGGFQVFDTIYVMTGGGPDHASEVLGTYAYWQAFSALGPGQLGYAATIAIVMVIVLFGFSVIRIRMSRLA